MAVKLYVKKLDGKTLEVIFCDTEEEFRSVTTLELKSKMNCEEGIPEDQMILVFAGQRLEDDKCLYDYGIRHESTVHMILKLRGGGNPDNEEDNTGLGQRDGLNRSMDQLANFSCRLS